MMPGCIFYLSIVMIARFDWQWQLSSILKRKEKPARMTVRQGGILLGGITVGYGAWLLFYHGLIPAASLPSVVQEMVQLLEMAGGVTVLFLWGVWFWRWKRPFTKQKMSLPTKALDDLYALSPREFEQYVAQLFLAKGYKVYLRGSSGDKGVDLELEKVGGKRAIVQCKRYRRAVGPEVVRELFGTLIHEQVSHAFLVTTAEISKSAREWAQDKPMTLIDGELLVQVSENIYPSN
ncbi:MAG: hypothetical protein CSA11_05465 [Chloroflexi bacterium]|nr:MAG: hypothetical protein CSA11_05465 [Chloroflexota bacterium]